ncbi:permease prefix domain 1-containing protein [Jeotgalibacillus terrae]|uniref:Permease prefix domain 1-containing protein n=1 Tax=Jeotgalibacillus terrae TaxID=587735 RepID=A0ABW5ZME5_9BACL|nr:permease prefix domain 1-containing protein [Jeotgalibacillus terrae]MBM7578232.1 magnesium-transporting ATPase (P-type) [Jeotgalibacillus terrae]
MKEIEKYVKKIIIDLPEDEKKELKEEIYGHLQEHVRELLIKGHSEDEAIHMAIESFGNQSKLNWEFKRSLFPFYKIVRFIWSVTCVTACLSVVSYSAMEYYYPQFDNSLPLYSVVMGFLVIAVITGFAEGIYEALSSHFKSTWLLNPWIFFLLPTLIIAGIQTRFLFLHPEQYQNGFWLELYAIPLGALSYIISRQLFTTLFVSKKKTKRSMVK